MRAILPKRKKNDGGCVYMRNFNPGRVQPGLKVCTIDKRGERLHEDSSPGSNTDMPPKVHFYSPVWSRESVRVKFASAVPFKPGARYAQKYVCTTRVFLKFQPGSSAMRHVNAPFTLCTWRVEI